MSSNQLPDLGDEIKVSERHLKNSSKQSLDVAYKKEMQNYGMAIIFMFNYVIPIVILHNYSNKFLCDNISIY